MARYRVLTSGKVGGLDAEDCHQQHFAKNVNGFCGLGGAGMSCPVGVAMTSEQ